MSDIHDKLDWLIRHVSAIERHLGIQGALLMSTAAEVQKAIEESNAATAAIVEVSASAVHALEGVTKRIEDAVAAFAAAHPEVDVSSLVASTAAEKAATAAIAAAIVASTPAATPAPTPATTPDPAPAPAPAPATDPAAATTAPAPATDPSTPTT